MSVSTSIVIGGSLTFTGTAIKAAPVKQSIDPLSTTIPYNTLDFTLYSAGGDFDIIDPGDIYTVLQDKQIVDVIETVDGVEVFIGRFYLQDWQALSPNEMILSAVDALGLLEQSTYNGGLWISFGSISAPILIDSLLNEIIIDAAGLDYEIDASLNAGSTYVTGWFPIGSCRTALQHVLFRIGAYATCAGSTTILIKKSTLPENSPWEIALGKSRKALSSPFSLLPLVTGVNLNYHGYSNTPPFDSDGDGAYDVNVKILFDDSLTAGDYLINIDPDIARGYGYIAGKARTATITGEDARPTYYAFTCTAPGTWNLVMEGFFKHSKWPYLYQPGSPTKINTIAIEDATMITEDVVVARVTALYAYYQLRYKLSTKMFGHAALLIGKVIWVQTSMDGKRFLGRVVNCNLDLVRGFVSEIEAVGNIIADVDYAVLWPGKYDDDADGINYEGDWNTAALVGLAYGDAIHYVGTGLEGYAWFVIYGNQFTMIYTQLTDRGSVNIYLDDVLLDTISENGSTDYQHEWASDEFTMDYHIVKLEHVSGAVTDLDAVVVSGVFPVGKYDDRIFQYLWDAGYDSLTTYAVGYQDTQTATVDAPQSYLEFQFYGRQIHIGYIGWNDVNDLHIQIDGGSTIDVDTNNGSSTKLPGRWISGDLGLDTHTIKIWGGGGGGEYILLDYIEIFNTYAATEDYEWYDGETMAWYDTETMESY